MDAQTNNKIDSKGIFRVAISLLVSIIAAKIVFIIFAGFAFFTDKSVSSFLSGALFSIGTIAGLFAGIFSFIKLNKYLKDEIQNP